MKVFIGYVSLSGNTEKMAVIIKNRMKAAGCKLIWPLLDYIHGIKKICHMKQTNFMKK
ncbi:hypothetical protein [Peribacillus butanolivorans]|uniref:hypothetical protein n=1 Tax=Peribacillus butanolivorans TaxID=421767 RepID=UPI00366ADFEC